MERYKSLVQTGVMILLLTAALPLSAGERLLTIIHTNDLHSHLTGVGPEKGADKTRGGWARIKTAIAKEKGSRKNPVLLLDAGDFMMGSLFHTISREEAIELKLLGDMGYDAISLGNHEFDFKPEGLSRVLRAAVAKTNIPSLLLANALFSREDPRDDLLEIAFRDGLVKPFTILDRQGIRIGIFGVMGKDAAEKAPFAAPVKFSDSLEAARSMVRQLREKERADVVICLSHSSLREDKKIAAGVEGIDIIIGGHSHTRLEKPLKVNNTLIVQTGAYGRYIGVLDLLCDGKIFKMKDYSLIEINDAIAADEAIEKKIASYRTLVDRNFLEEFGLSYGQVIARTDFDITAGAGESNLGNLVADSLRWYANRYDYDPKDPQTKVVAAVESNGVIRDDLIKGKTGLITLADIFRTVPLGIGADGAMAYPIVSCYLYASEIKKLLEITTSIEPFKDNTYFLQVSGLKFTWNPHRMLFDRVTEIRLGSQEEGYEPLDYSDGNKRLYRIAANIYNAAFIRIIGKFTWDILKIVPKDRYGNPITDIANGRIDADRRKEGVQELKEWRGLAAYLAGFKDINGDGIPDVPEKYRFPEGRIIAEPSLNPLSLLWGGNWLTWTVFAAFLIIIAFFTIHTVHSSTSGNRRSESG